MKLPRLAYQLDEDKLLEMAKEYDGSERLINDGTRSTAQITQVLLVVAAAIVAQLEAIRRVVEDSND